jgi:hypothetical protein
VSPFRFSVTRLGRETDAIEVTVSDGEATRSIRFCMSPQLPLAVLAEALLEVEAAVWSLPTTAKPSQIWREQRDADLELIVGPPRR